ncbi:MAG: L-seryl-tRNA(Sec) selenium transferase [Acidobacteriota bacterium]
MTRADLLRAIPSVDRLLAEPALESLLADHGRGAVRAELRSLLTELRAAADLEADHLRPEALADRLGLRLAHRYYGEVINATGVILHTGLGRAPLADAAAERLAAVAGRAQRLEIDPDTGERGGRDEGCARLLRELTGCEAATVVNNNAGATLLILAALARGRDVVLSRGEMVEIGGSYRVPDIMEESGAMLAGVGTTNRTHGDDYRRAIGDNTGLLLKVHTSNYRVEGFTGEVDIEELAAIGRDAGVPVVHDLGSGSLIDLAVHSAEPARRAALAGEPRVQHSLAAGADLVCFSGDKLVGGPQAGIIAGRREAVERCRRHPLFRALRPGRLVYAALEETLRIFRAGDQAALAELPVLRRLVADLAVLEERARSLAGELSNLIGLRAEAAPSVARAGSGSLPARDLPSWAVRLSAEGYDLKALAHRLRTGHPAIFGRLHDGALWLDLSTVGAGEISTLVARCRASVEAP